MKCLIKICFVNSYGYGLYNDKCTVPFGGAEVQLYLLSKEMVKLKDCSISIIAGDYDIKKSKILEIDGIKICPSIPLKPKIYNLIKGSLKLLISLIKLNPDVVIQRSLRINTFICYFFCKVFRKKFIYSIAHDNEVIKGGKLGKTFLLFRYGIINPHFIIAQSKDQISKLVKLWKKSIRNIKEINSGYRISENMPFNKDYILWVGRDAKWKRGELFIRLAKTFPNYNFVMICRKITNPDYWSFLRKESLKLHNLNFIEYVPFDQINNYFKMAKIFVNTSIKEGFPNTFIQALKNKTPIVSLNVNPDNILKKNKIGFYCNNDFNILIKNIKLLLENETLYELYSKNSIEYFKKNHNIILICKEWFKIIKKFI